MFQPLDPLLHAELRLAVMSLLISADEAEFLPQEREKRLLLVMCGDRMTVYR